MSDFTSLPRNQWTPERVTSVAMIVAAVLAGGIVLGLFASAANLYYVGAVIAAAALAIFIAWHFEAAMLAYILIAFMPWGKTPSIAIGGSGMGKGLYVSEIMLGFLLAIWAMRYMLSVLPKNRVRSGFHIPILIYIGYSFINVIHSFVFWDPHVNRIYQYPQVNAIEIALRILSAGAFLMAATSITSAKWLKWASLAVMIPGVYNLLNALAGSPIPLSAPWWPLIALLPLGYYWITVLDSSASAAKRALGFAIVCAGIFAIFIKSISWVSGWLGLLVCLAVITYMKNRKLFAAGLAICIVLVAVFWPFMQKNVVSASAKEGDMDRFSLLAGSMKYASTFPLGVGLGNYRSYNSFCYGSKWGTTSYTSAHDTYAQHLSEMGLPGLIIFTCIQISGFVWLKRSYSKMQNHYSKCFLLAAMGQMLGISLAAFIGDYIIPTYHNGGIVTFSTTVYSWLIWGLAVAHVRINGAGENGPFNTDRKLEHTAAS